MPSTILITPMARETVAPLRSSRRVHDRYKQKNALFRRRGRFELFQCIGQCLRFSVTLLADFVVFGSFHTTRMVTGFSCGTGFEAAAVFGE